MKTMMDTLKTYLAKALAWISECLMELAILLDHTVLTPALLIKMEDHHKEAVVDVEPADVGPIFQYDGERYRLDEELAQWYFVDPSEETELAVKQAVVPDHILRKAQSLCLID